MQKLGFSSKGDFQKKYFPLVVEKYFEGGNAINQSPLSLPVAIKSIITGLSQAWDEAEESESVKGGSV